MSTKKSKVTPTDQRTKKKAPTEIEAAENGVAKVKTTKIADFRRALVLGRSNLDKYDKYGGKDKMTLKIMGADGKESEMTIEYQIKLFKAGDWTKYNTMQKNTESGKEVTAMDAHTAAVIIGCLDEEGERVFSPKDVEFLQHPANVISVMSAATEILTASGATGDQDAVEKPA